MQTKHLLTVLYKKMAVQKIWFFYGCYLKIPSGKELKLKNIIVYRSLNFNRHQVLGNYYVTTEFLPALPGNVILITNRIKMCKDQFSAM